MQIYNQQDVFDKLMSLPGLRIFNLFYTKHKEILLYLLFGGLAFLLNIFFFAWIQYFFKINELINNIVCWTTCVLFQFFTNRTWVFNKRTNQVGKLLKQIVSFFSGRIFTLIVEEFILGIFISWLGMNSMEVKIVAQIIVIILNYVISKLWVFRK